MSLKRDTLVLPRLRAQAVEPFLLALAPHLALAAQMDLRLRLDPGGSVLALLPKRIDLAPGDAAPLLGRLAQAFEAAGRLASELERLPTQGRQQSRLAIGWLDRLHDLGALGQLAQHLRLGSTQQEG